MTFVNAGTLGAEPGKRDELVVHLTRRSPALADVGCLAYEVGVIDDEPDTVFVVEIWTDAAAHRASLELPDVQASIAAARLSGTPRPAGRLDTSTSRAALAAAMLPTSDSSAVDTPSQTTSTARLPGSADAATAVASSFRW